jgi:hypothetical protein
MARVINGGPNLLALIRLLIMGVISIGDSEVRGFNELPGSAAAPANEPSQTGVVVASPPYSARIEKSLN